VYAWEKGGVMQVANSALLENMVYTFLPHCFVAYVAQPTRIGRVLRKWPYEIL
jgi:hypothetical protein